MGIRTSTGGGPSSPPCAELHPLRGEANKDAAAGLPFRPLSSNVVWCASGDTASMASAERLSGAMLCMCCVV